MTARRPPPSSDDPLGKRHPISAISSGDPTRREIVASLIGCDPDVSVGAAYRECIARMHSGRNGKSFEFALRDLFAVWFDCRPDFVEIGGMLREIWEED